ncbi:MAG: hypothetical protein R3304_13320 [Longimicrobiales bacterium]|nr:hypothetical protein [Longimicrobiales bacterium]
MTEDDRELGLEPIDEAQDLPRVVEEAHEVLSSYGWQMLGMGTLAVAAWVVIGLSAAWLPVEWLLLALLGLVLVYFFPVDREPRLAKDVLRRWDDLRVERALESSGLSSDPRLEVAESMADRIMRHPSVDERTRAATRAMVLRLRRLLHDLRRLDHLARTRMADTRLDANRSISDLQDLLDARVGDILGRLAHLHGTVVMRDSASLDHVVTAVEDLARELEAEGEVERLLSRAEGESGR